MAYLIMSDKVILKSVFYSVFHQLDLTAAPCGNSSLYGSLLHHQPQEQREQTHHPWYVAVVLRLFLLCASC